MLVEASPNSRTVNNTGEPREVKFSLTRSLVRDRTNIKHCPKTCSCKGVIIDESGRSTGVLLYNNYLIGRTCTCGSRRCFVNVTTGGDRSTLHLRSLAVPRECQQRFDSSETRMHLTPSVGHG